MITNLHIYPSPFKFETRIMKETNSLLNLKLVDKIIISSLWEEGLEEKEKINLNSTVIRFKLLSSRIKKFSAPIKYLELILKLFLYFRKEKIDFVNCHSLLVLVIGVLLKKFGNSKILIYDPHELETERVGLVGLPQKFTKWLEKILINYVDKTIVVCDPIAEWYKREYNLNNIYVIQNMPLQTNLSEAKSTLLKDKFKIAKDDILYIYQGILAKERGIDVLLNTFANAQKNRHIVFMGFGAMENDIKLMSVSQSNIHFQPAVHLEKIIEYSSSADIGIFFISGETCLSYRNSLPNKFGEFIMAKLPVLVSSNLTHLTKIVQENECGWSLNSEDTKQLIEFVNSTDNFVLEKIKIKVKDYKNSIGWEFEEKKYLKIYKN